MSHIPTISHQFIPGPNHLQLNCSNVAFLCYMLAYVLTSLLTSTALTRVHAPLAFTLLLLLLLSLEEKGISSGVIKVSVSLNQGSVLPKAS